MEKTAKKIITTNKNFIIKKEREFKNFYELIQYYGYRKGMQNNITSFAKILINEGTITDLKIIYDDKSERTILKTIFIFERGMNY